jgi:hypothetical protein
LFLDLFIVYYDLKGGSDNISFKAIAFANETEGTLVNPEPLPTNEVAVMIPAVTLDAVKKPTVETPERLTFPDTVKVPLDGIVAPSENCTDPSSFLFVIELTFRLRLMI